MNQQYRIPTLTSRLGPHPVAVAVGENPVLEALAQWEAMVAAIAQADVNQLSTWARLHGTAGYQPLVYPGLALRRSVTGAQICHRRFHCWSATAVWSQGSTQPLKIREIESPKGDQNLSAATAERYFRWCLGCLGRDEPRRRGSTPTAVHPGVAEPSADPPVSPPIPNVAAVQELFVDVLAAGLAHSLELLVVG